MKTNKSIFKLLQKLRPNEKCLFHVPSNSMWPLIKIGDKVILQKKEIEKIKKFDVIIYYSNKYKYLVVHRVIKINYKNNTTSFITKGDNNSFKDEETINSNNFLGKIVAIKNKKINLNRNSYSWLTFNAPSKIFLNLKYKLFHWLNNSRTKSHF